MKIGTAKLEEIPSFADREIDNQKVTTIQARLGKK